MIELTQDSEREMCFFLIKLENSKKKLFPLCAEMVTALVFEAKIYWFESGRRV